MLLKIEVIIFNYSFVGKIKVGLGVGLGVPVVAGVITGIVLEEFCTVFKAKLWCLEIVNFIEVLEDIGCFVFWDVVLNVHVNLDRMWH